MNSLPPAPANCYVHSGRGASSLIPMITLLREQTGSMPLVFVFWNTHLGFRDDLPVFL